MAWNGSDRGKIKVEDKEMKNKLLSSTSTFNFNYKALCAGLIVIMIGGLLAWLTLDRARTLAAPQYRSSLRITNQEVLPIATKKTSQRQVWTPKSKVELTARATPPSRTTKDIIELGGLPSNCLIRASIFKNFSEGMIAGILTATPGDHFISNNDWDENFVKDFKKSLAEPTPVLETDSEDDKAVKAAVETAKQTLKTYMDNGDDIADIMRSAQEELEKIAAYRDQMVEILHEHTVANDADGALKFCEEANELLKEYNAEPLMISERRLERMRQKKALAEEGENE